MMTNMKSISYFSKVKNVAKSSYSGMTKYAVSIIISTPHPIPTRVARFFIDLRPKNTFSLISSPKKMVFWETEIFSPYLASSPGEFFKTIQAVNFFPLLHAKFRKTLAITKYLLSLRPLVMRWADINALCTI